MELVHKKLVNVIAELAKFADTYKNLPTLAFTHFQPAQPTTVGKRATLWAQEFIMDLEDLEYVMGSLKLLGSKGTTGTQASFLELFDGDQETIDRLIPEKWIHALQIFLQVLRQVHTRCQMISVCYST